MIIFYNYYLLNKNIWLLVIINFFDIFYNDLAFEIYLIWFYMKKLVDGVKIINHI